MYNKTFSIGDVLEQGWELFKKYWMMALLILGASIVTNIVTSFFVPIAPDDLQEFIQHSGRNSPDAMFELFEDLDMKVVASSEVVSFIIKVVLMVGFVRMAFFVIKGTKDELSFDAFNVPFMTYMKYAVVEFLVSVITGIGLLFCIIPGIIFAVRLQYATFYILEYQEVGIIESIKMSWNMTSGNFWRLLGFAIVGFLIVILGLLCCCIGFYVALAWLLFTDVLIYFALRPDMIVQEETTYNKEESL